MRNVIADGLAEHAEAIAKVSQITEQILDCLQRMQSILHAGGKVLVCGNGGSAADAQHFAAEMTGRFEVERRAYPVIALTTDSSALTAIGNDFGFEAVFSRQVEALARPGDMLFVISTSGNSPNLVGAVRAARLHGMSVVGLLGGEGGVLAHQVDLPLIVGVERTARIQEAHILILHLLCTLFEAKDEPSDS